MLKRAGRSQTTDPCLTPPSTDCSQHLAGHLQSAAVGTAELTLSSVVKAHSHFLCSSEQASPHHVSLLWHQTPPNALSIAFDVHDKRSQLCLISSLWSNDLRKSCDCRSSMHMHTMFAPMAHDFAILSNSECQHSKQQCPCIEA